MSTRLNFNQLEEAALAAWQPVKKVFDRLNSDALKFGEALVALRDACDKRGQFTAWLRRNRIAKNRAIYCLRLAQGKVKAAVEKRQGRFLEGLLYGEFYRACHAGDLKQAKTLAERLRKQVEEKIEELLETAEEVASAEKKAA